MHTTNVEFEWDDANLDHIALHGVEPEECEDAFINPGRQPFNTYSTANETRYGIVGRSNAGRILIVVFTLRSQFIRVVTARDASVREKRQYRR